MQFLKNLFGGGQPTGDRGIYVYVRLKQSGEIVQLRLTPGYDISKDDNGKLFSRKLVVGTRSRSYIKAEVTLYFSNQYQVIDADIDGGELSTRGDYEEQQAARQQEENA